MASTVDLTITATGKKLKLPTGLFINNQFVASSDSQEKLKSVLLSPSPLSIVFHSSSLLV